MDNLPDHYAALGISPSAHPEVIAAAYRALAKKFHPDTGTSRGSASPERFAQVQDAWETLGDPERRRRYDEMRGLSLQPRARSVELKGEFRPVDRGPVSPLRPGRGATVAPKPTAPRLAGQPHAAASTARRRSLAPVFAGVAILAVIAIGVLWFATARLTGSSTAALEPPEQPSVTPVSASAPGKEAASPPQQQAAVPAKPAAPKPASAEPEQASEVFYALSIVPTSGGAAAAAEPSNVMFSTRNRCESFGQEALERRRAAALERSEAVPEERFECVEFSAKSP
jgi:hypothetical protein